MRRHITGAARIGVVPPCPADVACLLQDQKVHALLLQRDGHAETGESGPDDERAGVDRLLGRALRRLISHGHDGTFLGSAVPGNFTTQGTAPQSMIARMSEPARGLSSHLAGPTPLHRDHREAPGMERRCRTHTVATVRTIASVPSATRLAAVPPLNVSR